MKRSPQQTLVSQGGVVVLAVHRGGGGLRPENTMPAFAHAAALGVDGLETDIHATKDGVLVAAHDAMVDRVSNGAGLIKAMSWAELQGLDFGYHWTADNGRSYPFRGQGITIPTLEELFAAYPDIWINIDIKQTDPPIVEPLARMIERFGLEKNLLVGSFDIPTIKAFRQRCPTVATAAHLNEARRLYLLSKIGLGRLYFDGAAALQIPEFDGERRVVDARFVRDAQRRGTAVHVWTVDEIADMERLLALGVDGLITDYPDRLLQLLGR